MGQGGFGTNQSVHWRIKHTGSSGSIIGEDPVPVDEIGEGDRRKGRKKRKTGKSRDGHKGFLRVKMRFTGKDAVDSLSKLLADIAKNLAGHDFEDDPPNPDFRVTADIPIIRRTKKEISSGSKDPWEITVDW